MSRLDICKKQAKQLIRWHREGNYSIGGRIRGLARYRTLTDRQALALEFPLREAQEIIALEARASDSRTRELLAAVNHVDSAIALTFERAFLAVLDGSCRTPIAGHAKIAAGRISFRGLIAKPDGSHVHETTREGAVAQASSLGHDAGRELKERAGAGFFALA